jgi:pSer/pThr/pTyr-binding forkhead associated (FHA) protein
VSREHAVIEWGESAIGPSWRVIDQGSASGTWVNDVPLPSGNPMPIRPAAFTEQHCAGATILLERLNRPNQMMRWMERLGGYDRTKLDMDAPVYRTPTAFVRAQTRADR